MVVDISSELMSKVREVLKTPRIQRFQLSQQRLQRTLRDFDQKSQTTIRSSDDHKQVIKSGNSQSFSI